MWIVHHQPLQIDAHYDEQKEQIQHQLVLEQQMISEVDKVYSVSWNAHLQFAVLFHSILPFYVYYSGMYFSTISWKQCNILDSHCAS